LGCILPTYFNCHPKGLKGPDGLPFAQPTERRPRTKEQKEKGRRNEYHKEKDRKEMSDRKKGKGQGRQGER